MTDHTHDASHRSWVTSANGHADFPLQNLPFGIFSLPGAPPRGGVAIGDQILDLAAATEAGLLHGEATEAASQSTLNALFALGPAPRQALRAQIFALLSDDARTATRERAVLHKAVDCRLHLPAAIGDYSDFYTGIHHARNAGKLFRPDNPLLPNYKHVPIAYHGRASSVMPSGTAVQRPNGQRKLPNETAPSFGPCRSLDFELEMGIWVGPGNDLGAPIRVAEAHTHIAGYCLLNDWSARDIQAWEYQPLGPFLAKSFLTSVSPWVITPEAMRPFRIMQPPRPAGDPAPLPYLYSDYDQLHGALNLELAVFLSSPEMRRRGLPAHRLSRTNANNLYWTAAQIIAHQTSAGCNLRPGDLLGSGTISGETPDSLGALLEITQAGALPVDLPTGEQRNYLEDGDEIVLRAHARRAGYASIGFGTCSGMVKPALPL